MAAQGKCKAGVLSCWRGCWLDVREWRSGRGEIGGVEDDGSSGVVERAGHGISRGHYGGCSVDGVVGVDVGFDGSAVSRLVGRVNNNF
jgi:hypothetical protein